MPWTPSLPPSHSLARWCARACVSVAWNCLNLGAYPGRVLPWSWLELLPSRTPQMQPLLAGFDYFDTAPWYGLGAAESVMGKWISKDNPQITIATKVGRVTRPASELSSTDPNVEWHSRYCRCHVVVPYAWGRVRCQDPPMRSHLDKHDPATASAHDSNTPSHAPRHFPAPDSSVHAEAHNAESKL